MAIIQIELWCTSVAKSGGSWTAQSASVLTTLSIDDTNNDGIIDNAEWDAFTAGGGGGLDQGSTAALYDGDTGTSGTLYSATEYQSGDDVTSIINAVGNSFSADPDQLGDVICFARGTLVSTELGHMPVENLRVGDRIVTLDNGPQPIRWIGASKSVAAGNIAPIVFQKGVIGNKRNLVISPQHRVLIRHWKAELWFAEPEVLVPAKFFVNRYDITRLLGGTVEYFHLLLAQHEIIFAEGIPVESLFMGDMAQETLDRDAHAEIQALCPDIFDECSDDFSPPVRPILKAYESVVLIDEIRCLQEV